MWEFLSGVNPIVLIVTAVLIADFAREGVKRLLRSRLPPTDFADLAVEVRRLRQELAELRADRELLAAVNERLGRIEAREVGGPFRAPGARVRVDTEHDGVRLGDHPVDRMREVRRPRTAPSPKIARASKVARAFAQAVPQPKPGTTSE